MDQSDSIAKNVTKVETMASQLEDLGHAQTSMSIVTKVLHSLPKSYRHVIAAWNSVSDDKRTMDELVPRLLKEEILDKIWDTAANEEDNAALMHRAGRGSGRCQHGHCTGQQDYDNGQDYQSTGQFNNQNGHQYKKKGKCHYCENPGHHIAEGRKKKADDDSGQANITRANDS